MACATLILAERGARRFTDLVAEHLPRIEGRRQGRDARSSSSSRTGAASRTPICSWRPEGHKLLWRPFAASRWSERRARVCIYHGRPPLWTGRPSSAPWPLRAPSVTGYRSGRFGFRRQLRVLEQQVPSIDGTKTQLTEPPFSALRPPARSGTRQRPVLAFRSHGRFSPADALTKLREVP
jgi:hypothetical protein